MRRLISVALPLAFLFLSAIPTLAQERSPELQRLDWFVGNWTFNEVEGESECERLGDYIVHCNSAWTTADGNPVEAVFLMRYDAEAEVYRGYRFYSGGYADVALGWVEDDTWTFVYEGPAGARFKFTGVASGDTWTFVWHRSVQGGPWEQTSEGSMTKVR